MSDESDAKQEKSVTPGEVVWITGLSGAGKSTIARRLYTRMRHYQANVVMLDGDHLRQVFGGDLGYNRSDRHRSAMRNARLCRMLVDQGHTVLCATVSMFKDVRSWNRAHISNYREVYVHAAIETLIARDKKGVYADLEEGGGSHAVGIGIEAEYPQDSDVDIDTDELDSEAAADHVWDALFLNTGTGVELQRDAA